MFLEKYAYGDKGIVFQNRKLVFGLYAKLLTTMLDKGLDIHLDVYDPKNTPVLNSRIVFDTSAAVVAREKEINRKINEFNKKIALSVIFESSKKSIKTHFDLAFKRHGEGLDDLEQIIAKQVGSKSQTGKLMELFKLAIVK